MNVMRLFFSVILFTFSIYAKADPAALFWLGIFSNVYQTDRAEHFANVLKSSGAERVDVVENLPSSLDGYRLIMVYTPDPEITNYEKAQLTAAYQSGVGLIVAGENNSWHNSSSNNSINEFLRNIGEGDIQLKNDSFGPWGTWGDPTTEVNVAHPMMTGVRRLLYNALSTIEAPASDILIRMPDGPYAATRKNLFVTCYRSIPLT